MGTVYLQEQGAKISRQGRRLLVSKEDQPLLSIPVHRLQRLVIIGRIQLTASALALLLDRGVSVVLLTTRGQVRGTLLPPDCPRGELRRRQYALAGEPAGTLLFCRELVRAKAVSAANVIRRYAYNHRNSELTKASEDILQTAARVDEQPTVDAVRGIEGLLGRTYFQALVEIFHSLEMDFGGRVRRPPADPVNACLSYVYMLLTALSHNALQATHLDPYCGIMHASIRNAPALTFDFVEQFRQPIADRFVMLLFNKKILQKADFQVGKGQPAPVLLSDAARKRLISEWEVYLHTPQRLIEKREPLSPFSLIFEQAEELEKSIQTGRTYRFYRLCL
ncbi:MAG TPA: CRISPR-associated endonuclease Cas1 [Anaerohalosphaeraceae bacterium]|nr:CRISPR-associated endonuclease Cas1 [Anaerohalosphaeraceae bacterium]HOL89462.1 CRISPR-associated endonuclease Cas1 [Anaerohalosphaeraceae bacterium]HPP55245.1 CRISPR-associated endonuclease Cas1 [Anaerohalosphaeraceae bacterium]